MVTVAGETFVTSHSKSVEEQRPEDPFPKSHTLLPSLSCRLSDLLPVPGDAVQLDTEVTRPEGPWSCPRGWAGGGVSRHTLAGNPGSQATLWVGLSFLLCNMGMGGFRKPSPASSGLEGSRSVSLTSPACEGSG